MPFSGPATYIETINEFIGHWTDVNAAISPGDMAMPSGYLLATLISDRDDLADLMFALEEFIVTSEMHRNARDNQEGPLLEDMKQLANYIRGPLANSDFNYPIPDLPSFEASGGAWQKAMRGCDACWAELHATPPAGFTPPLILPNTTTLAQFQAKRAAMDTTLDNLDLAKQDVTRSIRDRDDVYKKVREELGDYRATVLGLFGEEHPLTLSVPKLVPLPGHTPDPVVLSGIWNGSKAELTWTESTDSELDHYAVRRSSSNPYSTATESHVANVPIGTETHETLDGLEDPGTMRYKVYVVLTTGNERGSNAVEIENPGP
jgi:hypothetical protein